MGPLICINSWLTVDNVIPRTYDQRVNDAGLEDRLSRRFPADDVFVKALKIWEEAPLPYSSEPLEWREVGIDRGTFVWSGLEGVKVQATLSARGVGLEIGSLSVSGDAIDSQILRVIRIGKIRTAAIAQLRAIWAFQAYQNVIRQRYHEDLVENNLLKVGLLAISAKSSRGSRRSKTPNGDELLRRVAEEYFRTVEAHGNRGAHQRLARELSRLTRKEVSKGMAGQLVFRARRLGLLEPTKQGRASAVLGKAFFNYEDQGEAT